MLSFFSILQHKMRVFNLYLALLYIMIVKPQEDPNNTKSVWTTICNPLFEILNERKSADLMYKSRRFIQKWISQQTDSWMGGDVVHKLSNWYHHKTILVGGLTCTDKMFTTKLILCTYKVNTVSLSNITVAHPV